MMRFSFAMILLAIAVNACGPKGPVVDDPASGYLEVLAASDFPEEITGLLTAAEADSCGVCIRDKRSEAFAIADEWFRPGTQIRVVGNDGWRVLPDGEMELYFGDAPDPTLTFRFHTDEAHLVGIAPAAFTDTQLAMEILALDEGEMGSGSLVVIPFDYGDGESFLFDESTNRLQVQCRVLAPDAGSKPRTVTD